MKIVILTGAGISAESGLGTFRDKGGVWTKYDLGEVATPEGFARDPWKVHDFYNARRENASQAMPNDAHKALERLQSLYAGEVVLITQNVDALHEAAGSVAIHMHGRLDRAVCAACGHGWDAAMVTSPEDACPSCGERATRPDIVWFGETPKALDQIERHLRSADVFAAIGTSGQVYPAAGFVTAAKRQKAHTVEINLEPSELADVFDETIVGPATITVPEWVDNVLK